MELEKNLEQLGLSEKEAKVYLALLQLGSGSVYAVAKKAETKRPTTYLILEEIRKKRLATLLDHKENIIYSAESPEKLLEEQEKKQKLIKEKIPELMAIYNTKKEKPKVKFYQGAKEIIELYNNIFKEKMVYMYGSIAAISPAVKEMVKINWHTLGKNNVLELLENDEESIKYAKDYSTETHKIKIIPKEFRFPTDNMIYGNKLALFSYKDEPSGVVIEDSDVVTTYKSMFEIIWNSIK